MSVDTSQIAQLDVEPGELPSTMAAWVIRAEREGEPTEAFQLEEMEVPRPAAFEVDRARDGRRRELQQRLGGARQADLGLPLPPGGPPHRWLGRVRDRLGGRRGRDALEAGRRGRRALQPGLLRGPGGARTGPAGRAVTADLGLRDDLGLVRAVLQGPGPAAAPQAEGAGLGGGRLLRPDVLHRLPDARRPGAPAGGPPRPDLGRRRRARRVRHAAVQAQRRGLARRRLLGREGRAGQVARRRGLHRPQRVRGHDARRRRGLRLREGALQGVTPLRQGGRRETGRRAGHRLRARRARHVPDIRAGREAVRDDRDLRRDLRFHARFRRPLPVDAPEAHHRLALRQRLGVPPRERADRGREGPSRTLEDAGLRAGRRGPSAHVREQAPRQDRDPRGRGSRGTWERQRTARARSGRRWERRWQPE